MFLHGHLLGKPRSPCPGLFFYSWHRTSDKAPALVQWSWRPFWGCRRYDKSRPVASLRRVGALTYRSKRASNGIQVDQGVARKAKQKPEGEMEGTKTTAPSEAP